MSKQQFIIVYESAHWAGTPSNVIVWAHSEDEAEELAAEYMDEDMRELYSDEYSDDEELYSECSASVISVEPFGPKHRCWEYFLISDQAEFYPVIGSPD